VLGLLGFFYSLGNPLGALLFAKGRPDLDFYLNVWRAMHYAGAIGLGMNWGLQGVASALVFATAGGMFPLGFWLRKWLVEMTVAEYLRAFAPMLAASAAAAVGFAAELVIGSSEKLLILLPLRALVYLVLILPSQRSFFGRLRDTVR
jgi:O-antigen/teichoic acid export membrane protein